MKCWPLENRARKGNQVRVLNDPVTVTEERPLSIPLYEKKSSCRPSAFGEEETSMRRGEGAMILESGNLLRMARLNFRVKCNSRLETSVVSVSVCFFLEAGIFYGIRLFV